MIIPVVAVLIIRATATKIQTHRAARRNESFFLPPDQRRRDTLASKQCRHAVYKAFTHTNQISATARIDHRDQRKPRGDCLRAVEMFRQPSPVRRGSRHREAQSERVGALSQYA